MRAPRVVITTPASMFAVATTPRATVAARGGRAPAARATKGTHPPTPFHIRKGFRGHVFVTLFATVGSIVRDALASFPSLTVRCRRPFPSHHSRARTRELALEQGHRVHAHVRRPRDPS